MTTAFSRFLFIFLLPGLILPGAGQTAQKPLSQMSAAARQLIAIKVVGSKRFPEAAIAAATALQLGTEVVDDDFKKAARNLGDTGVFTDIAYSFSYSSAGTKVEFHVTDIDKFVPARFEDFVWFSDEELRRRIKEHVPLFDGELPLSGRMPDEVSDVLQAMLVENAIPGHVNTSVRANKTAPSKRLLTAFRMSLSESRTSSSPELATPNGPPLPPPPSGSPSTSIPAVA